MTWLEPGIKPLSILCSLAGVGSSHLRPGLTDVPARTSARYQSIFICYFYRLGRGDRIAHSRANLSRRYWSGVRRCNWVRYPDYCPSPCRKRRHSGNAAGGARHQYLASHSCCGHHHRLLSHVSRRYARHYIYSSGSLYSLAHPLHSRFYGADDLWRRLLCHALQFRVHRPRRGLSRSIVGQVLGLGPERKWRCPDRSLVRHHFACTLGRIYSPARTHDHGDLRQCGDEWLLVRSEHARRRAPFVWFHAKRISVAGGIYYQPACPYSSGEHAARTMAKLSRSRGFFGSKTHANCDGALAQSDG